MRKKDLRTGAVYRRNTMSSELSVEERAQAKDPVPVLPVFVCLDSRANPPLFSKVDAFEFYSDGKVDLEAVAARGKAFAGSTTRYEWLQEVLQDDLAFRRALANDGAQLAEPILKIEAYFKTVDLSLDHCDLRCSQRTSWVDRSSWVDTQLTFTHRVTEDECLEIGNEVRNLGLAGSLKRLMDERAPLAVAYLFARCGGVTVYGDGLLGRPPKDPKVALLLDKHLPKITLPADSHGVPVAFSGNACTQGIPTDATFYVLGSTQKKLQSNAALCRAAACAYSSVQLLRAMGAGLSMGPEYVSSRVDDLRAAVQQCWEKGVMLEKVPNLTTLRNLAHELGIEDTFKGIFVGLGE